MSSEPEFGIWAVAQSPVDIHYSLAVLESLRGVVTEGMQHLSRIPTEVGGVLYGTHEAGSLRIEAMRPASCQHTYGPGLQLSDQDWDVLASQMKRDRDDPELAGLTPVGWYVSHPRKEIALLPADLEIYHSFFPEPWQVAMVIRPGRANSMRAGFFVRESNGTVRADRSYQDFNFPETMNAMEAEGAERRNLGRRGSDPPEDREVARDFRQDDFRREAFQRDTSRRESFSPEIPRAEPFRYEPPSRDMARDAANEAFAPSQPADPIEELRSFGEPPVREKRKVGLFEGSARWAWLAAAMSVAALAGFSSANLLGSKEKTTGEPIYLSVLDRAGQMQVEWNRNSNTIVNASRASLEIVDGTDTRNFPLSQRELTQGNFVYSRRTGDIQVRMVVMNAKGDQTQEASRFVGDAPQPGETQAVPVVSQPKPSSFAPASTPLTPDMRPALAAQQAENARLRTQVQLLESTNAANSKSNTALAAQQNENARLKAQVQLLESTNAANSKSNTALAAQQAENARLKTRVQQLERTNTASPNSDPTLATQQAENARLRGRVQQLERTLVILQGRLGITQDGK